MRKIDADAFREVLHSIGGTGAEPGSWAEGWDQAIDEAIRCLDQAPTLKGENYERD